MHLVSWLAHMPGHLDLVATLLTAFVGLFAARKIIAGSWEKCRSGGL